MSTSLDRTEAEQSKLLDLLRTSTRHEDFLALPPNTIITKITPHGTSHWTSCFRVDTISTPLQQTSIPRAPRGLIGQQYLSSHGTRHDNATAQHESSRNPDEKNEKRIEEFQDAERPGKSYFVKIAQGENGRSMLKGEFMSAADIQNVSPRFCTRWVSQGPFSEAQEEALDDSYKYGNQNTREGKAHHYYISDFVAMRPPTPSDMQLLAHQLALFHAKSAEKCDVLNQNGRLQGKVFGYHTTTHNGKLAQDNTWTTTWEEYFTRNMRRMLDYDAKEGGKRSVEAEYLLDALFDKVMPRLLRPMEMCGRKISPSLCHGDVWEGNVGVVEAGEVMIFDPGCFWGHAEYDLRTLNKEQRDEYLRHVPATYPEDDFEARIMLYHLRSCLHDCALFPKEPRHRWRFMEETVVLVRMFPEGLVGWMEEMKRDEDAMVME